MLEIPTKIRLSDFIKIDRRLQNLRSKANLPISPINFEIATHVVKEILVVMVLPP